MISLRRALSLIVATMSLGCFPAATICEAEDLRLGIVGTDSSHAVEFTRILNDASAKDRVAGARIVAAYRGGNPKIALSRNRIEKFSSELKDRWSIPFVASIEQLCSRTDGILILSIDPSSRRREFEQAAACNKPIFLDKPVAPTLRTAMQIVRSAERHHVSWFSSSALRFVVQQQHSANADAADVWGPGDLGQAKEGYPLDLAWYGIHSLEALSGAMGPGITRVSRIHTKNSDIITAIWRDGRVGTVHLIRPHAPFCILYRHSPEEPTAVTALPLNYAPLVQAIVSFVGRRVPPVSPQETLEIFGVMEAAQRSMQANGALIRVRLSELHQH